MGCDFLGNEAEAKSISCCGCRHFRRDVGWCAVHREDDVVVVLPWPNALAHSVYPATESVRVHPSAGFVEKCDVRVAYLASYLCNLVFRRAVLVHEHPLRESSLHADVVADDGQQREA